MPSYPDNGDHSITPKPDEGANRPSILAPANLVVKAIYINSHFRKQAVPASDRIRPRQHPKTTDYNRDS